MSDTSSTRRLLSIDALRGFDMFWITGGSWLWCELCRLAVCFAGFAAYAALLFVVAPDAPAGASSTSLAGCFVGYLDRLFTPGHLYCGNLLEPSGPFVSFFGCSTALLGMCGGDLVRSSRWTSARVSSSGLAPSASAGLCSISSTVTTFSSRFNLNPINSIKPKSQGAKP